MASLSRLAVHLAASALLCSCRGPCMGRRALRFSKIPAGGAKNAKKIVGGTKQGSGCGGRRSVHGDDGCRWGLYVQVRRQARILHCSPPLTYRGRSFGKGSKHPPQVVPNSRRRRRSRRISGAWSLSIQKARPSSPLVKTEGGKPIYHAWMEKSLSLPSLCSPTPAPINVILNSSRTLILR